jgi:hypothetical protein
MLKYIWHIIMNSKKFKVVSPYYTSKLMTYEEAKFMKNITPNAKIIFVK